MLCLVLGGYIRGPSADFKVRISGKRAQKFPNLRFPLYLLSAAIENSLVVALSRLFSEVFTKQERTELPFSFSFASVTRLLKVDTETIPLVSIIVSASTAFFIKK